MSIFKDVTITWGGKDFVVPAERVMGLVCVVEDAVTIEDLCGGNGVKRGKTAKAFAAALNYAGCAVSEQDVYSVLFAGGGVAVTAVINSLLMMMIPPEHLQKSQPAKPTATRQPKPKKATGSSKRPTS